MSAIIPHLKPDNLEHCPQGYPEFIRENLHRPSPRCVQLPCFIGLRLSQFVVSNFFPVKVPTFVNFIVRVVLIRSKPKMVGVYARRIVALMANTQTPRNWTVMQYPRRPRCRYNAAFVPFVKASVVPSLRCTRPKPTRFRLVHFGPKPLRKRWGKTLRSEIIDRNFNHSSESNAVRVTGPAAFLVVNLTKRSKAMSNA